MEKITKIETIENMGVFKDFEWKDSVKDKNGSIASFSDINIFYGRNYSGKTTLSRIFRAFETGKTLDDYKNAKFSLKLDNNITLTQNDITTPKNFRVFNTDFIEDNLSFINNQNNGTIQSFSVELGEKNKSIITEIKQLETELENSIEKKGLYKEKEDKEKIYTDTHFSIEKKQKALEKKISDKASYMKNTCQNFISPNYNKTQLAQDISKIENHEFEQIHEFEVSNLKILLNENIKENIPEINFSPNYDNLRKKLQNLLSRKIDSSDKIKELVENALLNNWVKEGIGLHVSRSTCAFCGQPLPAERISELQHHFNDEMNSLQKELSNIIKQINEEISKTENITTALDKTLFYAPLQEEVSTLTKELKLSIAKYIEELKRFIEKAESKEKNVFTNIELLFSGNIIKEVIMVINKYNKQVHQSNDFGKDLQNKKDSAREKLRLNTVNQFIKDSNYLNEKTEIKKLGEEEVKYKNDLEDIKNLVEEKEKK